MVDNLRISLLGPFDLRQGAQAAITPPLPKKAQALLAYLVMHAGQPIAREKLANLLWGDRGREQARQSLRQCLVSLRGVFNLLPADHFVATVAEVSLEASERVELDVRRFESLSQSTMPADIEEANRLYRDAFLTGLDVASEPFDDWVAVERQRLSVKIPDLLRRVSNARARRGDTEAAIEAAQRLITLDPLNEEGHRLMMRLLASAGRRSAALKHYAACTDTLRRELDIVPERATSDLAEAIRNGVVPAETTFSRDAATPTRAQNGALLVAKPDDSARPPIGSVSDKASLAILPFNNLSGDPDQDYFADGIAEDITVALGQVPWLFVIANSSTFKYRGPAIDVKQAGTELGVQYVLRGSVRRQGTMLRIVAQLNDVARGGHIWAERFDGELDRVFEIQERVATQVSAMIAPALRSMEIERAKRTPTENLNAYDLYLRALPRLRTSLTENQEAVKFLQTAIALDPSYGAAYGLAARCYQFQKLFGWIRPSDAEIREGIRFARLASEIGKNDSEALWMAGHALAQLNGEVDRAIALIERSLSLNANSASAWTASCLGHAFRGDADIALKHFEHAQRLNPQDLVYHTDWYAAAVAHFVAGNYREASLAAEKTLNERPTYPPALRLKAVVCGLLGQTDEAREYVTRVLVVNPDLTVAWMKEFWEAPWKRIPHRIEKYLEGLRLAGLPEK